MPISNTTPLYEIHDLRIEEKMSGKALRFQAQRAQVVVLCESPQGIKKEDLKLDDKQLGTLYGQGTVRLPELNASLRGYRVFPQGISLKDMKITPPTVLQLWSIAGGSFGTPPTLYVPEDIAKQRLLVKLMVRVSLSEDKGGSILQVTLENGREGAYQSGSVLYRVGEHLPVPISADWIGRSMLLNAPAADITVFPGEAYQDVYQISENQ